MTKSATVIVKRSDYERIQQDLNDALSWGNFARCGQCLRLTPSGYLCPNGHDLSDTGHNDPDELNS